MRLKLILTLTFCFGIMSYTCSQSHPVADSLFEALDQNPHDSIAFIELNKIIIDNYYSKTDLAMDISKKKLHFARESRNQLEIGNTLLHIGIIHELNASYDSALSNYVGALQLAEENDFNKLKANVYRNLSICLSTIGNMEESVSYSLKALEVFEILKDSAGVAAMYNGLGNRYSELDQYDKSLEYYEKAAHLNQKLGRTPNLSGNYGNIGLLYLNLEQSENALKYLQKSLALIDTVNNLYDYSLHLQYHVTAYNQIKDYKRALIYQERAYEIAIELDDEYGIFKCMEGFGHTYDLLGEYDTALEYFKRSEEFAERVGSTRFLTNLYSQISSTYAHLNNYQKAYEYNRKYSALNDTILTTEKVNAIQRIKEFDVDKKQKEITVLTQDAEIQSLKAKRQQAVRNSFIIGFVVMVIFVWVILLNFLQKRKANRKIVEQNEQITEANEELKVLNEAINKQNHEIIDSINYAQRIQSALLPPETYISELLNENFILYKPRDIVSGDFYWIKQVNQYIVLVAADCTGHGVPGAFMSMLGMSYLNEIVQRREITQANQVLNELRKQIKYSLRQHGQRDESKDGIDMALCVMDLKSMKMQYAGANNPLYLIKDVNGTNELKEIKADRMPLGYYQGKDISFVNHDIQLDMGDTFYMFSDGFIDQRGGKGNKKFLSKNFKDFLLEIHDQPMQDQKEILDKTLLDWMGDNSQMDDVLVIGVRV
ncbi:MAG: tetratricopeptide repeat protein [Bacteroidota bacterium]|nr:tetratricopeptide repeat protein [Bacteroidota bacterium]